MTHARNLQAKYHDKSVRFRRYQKGQRVYYTDPIPSSKLAPKWLGPYTVCRDSNAGLTYEIVDMNVPQSKPIVVHHDKLKPCVEVGTPVTPSGYIPPPVAIDHDRPTHPGNEVVPPQPPRPPDTDDFTIVVTPKPTQIDRPPSPEVFTPPPSPGAESSSSSSFFDRDDRLDDHNNVNSEDEFFILPFHGESDTDDLNPTRSGRQRRLPKILKDFVTF